MSSIPTEQPDVVVRPGARLLSKDEMLARVSGLTYPHIWNLMRKGKFPRSVVIGGGKSFWLEHEIDAYIASLPRRRLKGQTDGVPYGRRWAKAEGLA